MNDAPIQIRLGRCETQGEATSEPPIDSSTRYEVDDLEGRLGTFDAATVINISLGGLAIETHKYLQVGKSYPLRFKRPAGLLRLSATAVWSRLVRTVAGDNGESLPVYKAGFKFSDMSGSQRAELEEFVIDEVTRTAANRAPSEVKAVA